MKKLLAVGILGLIATPAFAQSTITFNVNFNKVYTAAGAPVPTLTEIPTDPINLTGTVTLTAIASATQLTGGADLNNIVLNGSWNTVSIFNPPNTQQVFTYDNAVFSLFGDNAYFANEFTDPLPQPIYTGTSVLGQLSDDGPASLYGGTCPNTSFSILNCQSPEPLIRFEPGLEVFNGVDSNFPTLADAGWHALISGSATQETLNGGTPLTDLSHDNGLDGFFFEGGLDTNVEGAIVPGGIVRIVMTSASGNTMYVVEGTTSVIPIPAAAWLFASALGLLGWIRRRSAVRPA
jgi:hypothetical protein